MLYHEFKNNRLPYDEGTPHIWDKSKEVTVFYNDNLKYQITLTFNASGRIPYKVNMFSIDMYGNLTKKKCVTRFYSLDYFAKWMKNLPVYHFGKAYNEFMSV